MRNSGRRLRAFIVPIATTAVVLATALPALAASGDPDPSFGGDGSVRTDFVGQFDISFDVIVQPNGRIVAVGQAGTSTTFGGADFGIARYLSNGDPDTSFSGDGRQRTDFSGTGDSAGAVALQDDGRIVVAGVTTNASENGKFAVVRYTTGGALDHTFSGDGKVATAFAGYFTAAASDVAVQGDGRIVVVGSAASGTPHLRGGPGEQNDIAVARYKPGGALDTTFGGGDGRVTTDFAGNFDSGHSVLVLGSGDILVAGSSQTMAGEQRIVVVEYRPNGTLDTAFSGDGKIVVNMSPGQPESAAGIAVRGDGKIMVGASVRDAVSGTSDADLGVLLLTAGGTIATTFGGGDGMAFADFGGTEDPDQMVRDTDGKLYFVATRPFASPTPQAIWVFRLTSAGAKDTSFGTSGRAELDDPDGVGGFGLAVDGSHRPVAVGRVGIGNDGDFAVARFLA
jgi:uncharacterized delta-60 repeat protein